MAERELQRSENWGKISDDTIDKAKSYDARFPRYFYSADSGLLHFKLLLSDGTIIENATVDTSTQYRAEGLNWKDSRGKIIYPYNVVAWCEIESNI